MAVRLLLALFVCSFSDLETEIVRKTTIIIDISVVLLQVLLNCAARGENHQIRPKKIRSLSAMMDADLPDFSRRELYVLPSFALFVSPPRFAWWSRVKNLLMCHDLCSCASSENYVEEKDKSVNKKADTEIYFLKLKFVTTM